MGCDSAAADELDAPSQPEGMSRNGQISLRSILTFMVSSYLGASAPAGELGANSIALKKRPKSGPKDTCISCLKSYTASIKKGQKITLMILMLLNCLPEALLEGVEHDVEALVVVALQLGDLRVRPHLVDLGEDLGEAGDDERELPLGDVDDGLLVLLRVDARVVRLGPVAARQLLLEARHQRVHPHAQLLRRHGCT